MPGKISLIGSFKVYGEAEGSRLNPGPKLSPLKRTPDGHEYVYVLHNA